MAEERAQRRLAAILAADVVGFSRAMARDEGGTLAALKTLRTELFEPRVRAQGGRIFKITGDGALCEFPSAVEAVRAAQAVQEALAARNTGLPEERRIALRIGVALGDVLTEGGDLYGHGVNLAARLEGLAEPGGICVAANVAEHLQVAGGFVLADLGEHALKNIERPVRVYSVRLGAAEQRKEEAAPAQPALALPDKPSIAVLAFQNMSDDPDQEYFADGIVEDITAALSRIRGFFVIARNSAFAYKGRAVDVKQIGRELGVRYVLEGSVRKSGGRIRITGQLIDAESGVHLWADKYDSSLEDVFDLQDRVTASVVGAIEPSITRAEVERTRRKPPDSLQAYDLLLQALDAALVVTSENFERALEMSQRALMLDPRYARAWSAAALIRGIRWTNDWAADANSERAATERSAHRAVEFGADDPTVLTDAGLALALIDADLGCALAWLDRAIALNPNSAYALGVGAQARNLAGDYATAADHAKRAMRLSPFDPMSYRFALGLGVSHLFRHDLPEAVVWLRKAAQQNPGNPSVFMYLSSALAHLGRLDEARAAMDRLLALRPSSSLARAQRMRMHKIPTDLAYLNEGARLAGLPD